MSIRLVELVDEDAWEECWAEALPGYPIETTTMPPEPSPVSAAFRG